MLRAGNSYLGTTSVERGQLLLDMSNNVVIQGNIEIGTGVAGPVIAEVLVTKVEPDRGYQPRARQEPGSSDGGHCRASRRRHRERRLHHDQKWSWGPWCRRVSRCRAGSSNHSTGANILLEGPLTATSSAKGPARIFRSGTDGVLLLGGTTRIFTINDGPSTTHDLTIDVPITSVGNAGLIKQGAGNPCESPRPITTEEPRSCRLATCGWSHPRGGKASPVRCTSVDLRSPPASTCGARAPSPTPRPLRSGRSAGCGSTRRRRKRSARSKCSKGGEVVVGGNFANTARLVTPALSMEGGRVFVIPRQHTGSDHDVEGLIRVIRKRRRSSAAISSSAANGSSRCSTGRRPIDLRVSANILGGAADGLQIAGPGVTVLSGRNTYGGATVIGNSTVLINGQQPDSPITVANRHARRHRDSGNNRRVHHRHGHPERRTG